MTNLHKERTYFLKATRSINGSDSLSTIRIAINKIKKIETTLLLDTNILIRMEKVVQNGNKKSTVKDFGLHNLVELGLKAPPESLHFSPGLALREMPPGLAEQARQAYEIFLARHLPHFVDSPGSTKNKYFGKTTDFGYFDLEPEAQFTLAVPFCSLIHLQIIDATPKLKPIEKFKYFLDVIESEIDLLSFKEVEIARHCFANPPAEAKQLIKIRRIIRRNFLQTADEKLPRNADQLLKVAFNGACDLNLINSANVMDDQDLDGIEQDCWITTCDKKLYQLIEIAHHLDIDGNSGKYINSVKLHGQEDDDYWKESESIFHDRIISRKTRFPQKSIGIDTFSKCVSQAKILASNHFSPMP